MDASVLEVIRVIGDVAVIPLGGILWSMQGRLSRIEGLLSPRSFHERFEEK